MWEDKFDVYIDALGDGNLIERLAADMDLDNALLLMGAYMEKYYNDQSFNLIIKHTSRKEYPREE